MFRMNSFLVAISLFISFNLYAEDAGQMMPDQGTFTDFERSLDEVKGESAAFPDTNADQSAVSKLKNAGPEGSLPGSAPEMKFNTNAFDPGQGILGMDEDQESIRTYSKEDVLDSVEKRSEKIFSISYIKDDFEYKDQNNIFSKTYEDATGSMKAGMLTVSMEKILFRKWMEGTWGLGGGVGFNRGKGQFVDGQSSEAEFKLYTIPLDMVFGLYFPLGRFAKLSARGGPSALGLYQNRSDFEDGNKYKQRRQIGYGYFGEAKFQLSLTNLFRSSAFHLYSDYQISAAYLDLKVRVHDYNNFQDEDVSVSGQSIGIGLTFEYL